MLSEFNSVSLMGVSNPEMFLSEKDLNSMEFNFLVTHECQIAPFEDIQLTEDQEELQKQEEEEDNCKILVSSLKLKLPSKEEFKVEDDDDGFKTPTSSDKKIPVILKCPPAPRKPKSLPSTKRKAPQRRRILLDLSNEIDSLFPPSLLADLGGKIKKVRQGNDTKHAIKY